MIINKIGFKENYFIIGEKENPSLKVVLVEEELHDIDIDNIGNLGDYLPSLVFIYEE